MNAAEMKAKALEIVQRQMPNGYKGLTGHVTALAIYDAIAAIPVEPSPDYPAILERERTAVADAANAIKKALDSRRWLYEGHRGSYSYDDDRFYAEFKKAIAEIDAATEPLKKIASDFAGCPKTQAEVVAARAAIPIEPDPRDAQIAVGKIMLLRTALHGLVSDRHGHDQGCACPWCFARAALSATEPKEPA